MKKLVIIALVAVFATSAFAWRRESDHHANTPWEEGCSVQIPVVMEIGPVCWVDLDDNAVILLELSDENTDQIIWYEGVCFPPPVLTANVSVDVSATIDAVEPNIESSNDNEDLFHVALRNTGYTSGTSGPIQYDPLVAQGGVNIEIAAAIANPDLSVRNETPLNVDPWNLPPVAVVTLTVTPLP